MIRLASSAIPEFLLLGMILLLLTVAGDRLLHRFGFNEKSRSLRFAMGGAAGMSFLSIAFWIAGRFGQANSYAAAAVFLVLYLFSRKHILPFFSDIATFESKGFTAQDRLKEGAGKLFAGWQLFEWLLLATFILFLGLRILFALAPEIGADALSYHLAIPKMFLNTGKIFDDPQLVQTAYPLFGETLFSVGIALRLPALAKLFSFGAGILSILAIMALAKEANSGDRKAGLWAAAIFLTTPVVGFQFGTADVETFQILFTVLCAIGLVRNGKQPGGMRWLVFSSVMAGLCFSVKYNGAFTILAAGLIVLVISLKAKKNGTNLQPILRTIGFFLITALVSSPWWLKNIAVYGNPVYPFLASIFGGDTDLIGMVQAWQQRSLIDGYGMGHDLIDLVLLPVRMTFSFDRFGWYSIGLVYLVGLLLLAIKHKSLRGLQPALSLAGLLFVGFALSTHQTRFLSPLLAILSACLGVAIVSFKKPVLSALVKSICLGMILLNLPWLTDLPRNGNLKKVDLPLGVLSGSVTEEQYFDKIWKDRYRVYRYLEEHGDEKLITVEFKTPLRSLTQNRVWTPVDSPAAFALHQNLSTASDLEALSLMKQHGIGYAITDEYIENTLFNVPFWNRLSLPVFRSGDLSVCAFFLSEAIPLYSQVDDFKEVSRTPDGEVVVLDWQVTTTVGEGVSLVVEYNHDGVELYPATLVLYGGGYLLDKRKVPHKGAYRLEGFFPEEKKWTSGSSTRLTVRVEDMKNEPVLIIRSASRMTKH